MPPARSLPACGHPAPPALLGLAFALGCLLASSGCTVVGKETGPGVDLVSQDAPVYDPSFRDLAPEELDLSRFWTEPRDRGEGEGEGRVLDQYAVSDLVEQVAPAVVNLYTVNVQQREARVGIHPNDLLPFRLPLVSRVLDFIPFQVPIPFRTEGLSLGSGFLINARGFVVTNAHVVQNATQVRAVRLGGREEVEARIVGRDVLTDTALLRIPPPADGAFLPLADSERLRVGELVVAVGNPLGLTHSVSLGVVSATDRVVPIVPSAAVDFVQTDAAINPGNSGGPLLNLRGEVVGINTAIATEAQAIGFALPSNTLKAVMPLLVTNQPQRGWLGAGVDLASLFEAPGVRVDEVEPDGPADRAGLRVDDRILALDGRRIESPADFRHAIVALRPGQRIRLDLRRAGAELALEIELDPPPGAEAP